LLFFLFFIFFFFFFWLGCGGGGGGGWGVGVFGLRAGFWNFWNNRKKGVRLFS